MPAKRWKSPEHDDLLRKYRSQDLYVREIAKLMGFTAPTIYVKMRELELTNNSKIGRSAGVDRRLIKRNAEIIADIKRGVLPKMVAKKFELTPQRILQIIKSNEK